MKFLFLFFFALSFGLAKSQQDSLRMVIVAEDLSEDFGLMSTKDDEVLLLLFSANADSLPVHESLFYLQMCFSESIGVDSAMIPTPQMPFLFIMLETDEIINVNTIAASFVKHFDDISQAHRVHDYNRLEEYIGDTDVLGIRFFSSDDIESSFQFRGIYKLDKYVYQIDLKHH